MKTYTKTQTITRPRLEISVDECPESPREWDNLGYFITQDRNYYSPDKNEDLQLVIKSTGEQAESQAEHMKLIKEHFVNEKIIAIYPVYKYEHGNVYYKRGTARDWDISNNGFYIITDKTAKIHGTKPKDFEKVIDQELETYTKYANGEVYNFILYDKDGEVEDSCGGYYSIDDIKSQLPPEWKDEDLSDYLST